jgi:hypothetical protein
MMPRETEQADEPQASEPTGKAIGDMLRLVAGVGLALALVVIYLITRSAVDDAPRGDELIEYARGSFRALIVLGLAVGAYIGSRALD